MALDDPSAFFGGVKFYLIKNHLLPNIELSELGIIEYY